MTFSVVTPSYNQGRYIRDCIESVQAQREPGLEVEHIVIDACSTDGTLGVLEEFSRLQWISEPDNGQTDAINKGFSRATGEWLMWLNADDYLLPGALKKVKDFVERNPETDVVYGDCYFVDENKKILREKHEADFDFHMLLYYGCYIPSTSSFYRRRIVDEGHLLDDSLKVVMDLEYYLRIACAGYRFRHLPDLLAGFRWHGSNISVRFAETRFEERARVTSETLERLGRTWMDRRWLLSLLGNVYSAKRFLRRKFIFGGCRQ